MAFAADTHEMQAFLERTFDRDRPERTFTKANPRDRAHLDDLKRLAGLPIASSRPQVGEVRTRHRDQELVLTISTQPTAAGEQIRLRRIAI